MVRLTKGDNMLNEMTVNKQDLINMLKGRGAFDFSPMGTIKGYDHLIRFSGNQHNEKWDWKTDELLKIPDNELYCLYRTGNELEDDR